MTLSQIVVYASYADNSNKRSNPDSALLSLYPKMSLNFKYNISACSSQLSSLTNAELTTYISTYDIAPAEAGELVKFGTVQTVQNGDGTYSVSNNFLSFFIIGAMN